MWRSSINLLKDFEQYYPSSFYLQNKEHFFSKDFFEEKEDCSDKTNENYKTFLFNILKADLGLIKSLLTISLIIVI